MEDYPLDAYGVVRRSREDNDRVMLKTLSGIIYYLKNCVRIMNCSYIQIYFILLTKLLSHPLFKVGECFENFYFSSVSCLIDEFGGKLINSIKSRKCSDF